MHRYLAGAALVALALMSRKSFANEPVTITVHAGARQTFGGFGASSTEHSCLGNPCSYYTLPQATKDQLCKEFWGKDGLDARVFRIWRANVAAYKGMIDDARKVQPDLLVLYAGSGCSNAGGTAADIKMMRNSGIDIYATGLCNEPNVSLGMNKDNVAQYVKQLRSALNAQGLQDVKIITPEASNVDGYAYETVEAIIKDQDALDALDAFATHSYSMCTTKEMADIVGPYMAWGGGDKEYWQTESSDNGPETDTDVPTGALCGARLINDLNFCVTHFVHFIMYTQDGGSDQKTRVMYWSADTKEVRRLLKYYYYKQVIDALPVGTVMRNATTDLGNGDTDGSLAARINQEILDSDMPDNDKWAYFVWDDRFINMEYTYGLKPPIFLAAGERPDGSWGIGITNLSGGCSPLDGDSCGQPVGAVTIPKTTFDATIVVEELQGSGEIEFEVYRTNATKRIEKEATVTMVDGTLEVTVPQYDLITFRSVEPIDAGADAARSDRAQMHSIVTTGDRTRPCEIRFTAAPGAVSQHVRVTVTDLQGRTLERLFDGMAEPGSRLVTWDLGRGKGHVVPAGAYFVNIDTGTSRVSERIVLR